jgi:hypothetical protein
MNPEASQTTSSDAGRGAASSIAAEPQNGSIYCRQNMETAKAAMLAFSLGIEVGTPVSARTAGGRGRRFGQLNYEVSATPCTDRGTERAPSRGVAETLLHETAGRESMLWRFGDGGRRGRSGNVPPRRP